MLVDHKSSESCCCYYSALATREDASSIEKIVNGAISKADTFRIEGLDRITAKEIKNNMKTYNDPHWYVLKSDIENCVSTLLYQPKTPKKGSIQMFATRVDMQHQGLGAKLLKEVLIRENAKNVSLWCVDKSSLVKYYEKLGFRQTGKRKDYDAEYLKPEMIGLIKVVQMKKAMEKAEIYSDAKLRKIHHDELTTKSRLQTILDLSQQKIQARLFSLMNFELLLKMPIKKINVSGQVLSDDIFKQVVTAIKTNNKIKELHVTKEYLTEEQKIELMQLTGTNELKGFKITTSEGSNLGSVHTNWSAYAEAKKDAYKNGMHEATFQALTEFRKEYNRNPNAIIDFGAGTGTDTINLALQGCPYIMAVDGDTESLRILKKEFNRVQKEQKLFSKVTCINTPFIKLEISEPVEMLVSSFTWPYRRPSDFLACFDKCIQLVKIGGYISGNFFGPLSRIDPGLTYHTKKDIEDLLSHNFKIRWFREDKGSFKIYGGEIPPWGILYHVVAKKVR